MKKLASLSLIILLLGFAAAAAAFTVSVTQNSSTLNNWSNVCGYMTTTDANGNVTVDLRTNCADTGCTTNAPQIQWVNAPSTSSVVAGNQVSGTFTTTDGNNGAYSVQVSVVCSGAFNSCGGVTQDPNTGVYTWSWTTPSAAGNETIQLKATNSGVSCNQTASLSKSISVTSSSTPGGLTENGCQIPANVGDAQWLPKTGIGLPVLTTAPLMVPSEAHLYFTIPVKPTYYVKVTMGSHDADATNSNVLVSSLKQPSCSDATSGNHAPPTYQAPWYNITNTSLETVSLRASSTVGAINNFPVCQPFYVTICNRSTKSSGVGISWTVQ